MFSVEYSLRLYGFSFAVGRKTARVRGSPGASLRGRVLIFPQPKVSKWCVRVSFYLAIFSVYQQTFLLGAHSALLGRFYDLIFCISVVLFLFSSCILKFVLEFLRATL